MGFIVQRSPPFQNTFVFGLQLQLALSRNSDLKNVRVETPDGRRRRFLPKNSQPIEVVATLPLHWRTFRLACFPQKNHSSLSSKSPSSPPQRKIAPSPFNSRRSTSQLRLQIADDLILLAFLRVLCASAVRARKPRKANGSRQSAPNSPEPPTAFLPCNWITRCPTKSAGNSFLLARTKNTIVADCLIRANHCQMVAVTHQRRVDPNIQKRRFFIREQVIHLRLPALVPPTNSCHAIPFRPRVVSAKPEVQHEFVERTRSFSVCTRSDFRQRDRGITNKTTIFEAAQTDVAISTKNNIVPRKSRLETFKATRDLLQRFTKRKETLCRASAR